MKKIRPSFVLAAICLLLPAAQAQETTVMPPPGAVTPERRAAPPADATGAVAVARAPKGDIGSFFTMNGGSSTNRGMDITSDRGEVDYKEMVLAFDGNVHVVDPRYEMTCERMLVFMEGTNQVRRIIASGKVVATQPERRATCDRAVYEHATGAINLTGTPAVVTRGTDRVVSPTIILYLNDQRILMEGGVRVNVSEETMKKRDGKP
ncbi:MAG: LptA/OstA family protein [Kiritimatiellia bacterium]